MTLTQFIEKKKNQINENGLTQDLAIEELQKNLLTFKKSKSPGSDGLSGEFYLTFWGILAHDLLSVFTDFEKCERLSESFRTGILSLIYKTKNVTKRQRHVNPCANKVLMKAEVRTQEMRRVEEAGRSQFTETGRGITLSEFMQCKQDFAVCNELW